MKRRFLAMLLALAMVFTMVPMAAAATEDSDEDSVELYEGEDGGNTGSTGGDGGSGGNGGEDAGDDSQGDDSATAKPTLDVGFFADGTKVKAAIEALDKSKENAEALDETTYGPNTMWVRVTLPTTSSPAKTGESTTYRLEVVAPSDKKFTGKAATQDTEGTSTGVESVVVEETIPGNNETSPVVVHFSLKGADTAETYITGDDLSGKYTLNLYENTGGDDSSNGAGGQQSQAEGDDSNTGTTATPVATKEITLAKVTANFGTDVTKIIDDGTAAAGTTALSEEPTQYIYTTNDAKTTAYFFANTEDLKQGEEESYYAVLERLLTFKTGNDNTSYEDTTSKEWRYDDATTTFTYTDIVTVAAATVGEGQDNPVTVPTGKETVEVVTGADKKKTATIEVQVTKNYIPQATGKAASASGGDQSTPAAQDEEAGTTGASIDFTLITEGSGSGTSAKDAVWQATVEEAVIPDDGTITVSAVPAVTVKVAPGNNEVTLSDGVVTASTATNKIAMFKMTSTTTGDTTTYKATITVQCARQPIVTGSTDSKDTFTEVDKSNPKKWQLVKTVSDGKGTEITVGTVAVPKITELTATAARGTGANESKITLKVTRPSTTAGTPEMVSSFQYAVFETEPTAPKEGEKLAAGFTSYNSTNGINYTNGNDYVAVANVNEIGEITEWGVAVIPKTEPTVDKTVAVETENGKNTVETGVTANDVDTALEAAIQQKDDSADEPPVVKLDFSTSNDDSSKEIDVITVSIPADSLDKVVAHNENDGQDAPVSVAVNTPAGDVIANPEVLAAIQKTVVDDISGATNVETKVVLSITKEDVNEGTGADEKKVAESFDIEFEKVTTYKTSESDQTVKKVTNPVKVNTDVKVSVPTSLTPKAGSTKLFAYFKDATGKLQYVGTATKDSKTGRATFTAPHLSTYVLYADVKPEDGIGVSQVVTENGEEVEKQISFEAVEDQTNQYAAEITIGKDEDSVTLSVDTDGGLTVGKATDGEYNSTTGVFKLATGKTSATLPFTMGTVTYTLTLKKEADTPVAGTVSIKIGSGTPKELNAHPTTNDALTAEADDVITIEPKDATVKEGTNPVTVENGVLQLGVGEHNLTITSNSKTYNVKITRKALPANTVAITVGDNAANVLKAHPETNAAITASESDTIVINPKTGITVTEGSTTIAVNSTDGSLTLGVGTHELVIKVGANTYNVKVIVEEDDNNGGDDDDNNGDDDVTPTTPVEDGGEVIVDGKKGDAIEFKGTGSTKTATVKVVSGGSAISFKVGSGVTSVTLKSGSTSTSVPVVAGVVTISSAKPGDTVEFTSGTTKYVMNFELAGTPSTPSNLTVTAVGSPVAGKNVFQKLKVQTPQANHRYLFKVTYKSMDDYGIFTMTSGADGTIIVKTDTNGYEVDVYEFSSGTNDMIVNGSVSTINQTDSKLGQDVVVTDK